MLIWILVASVASVSGYLQVSSRRLKGSNAHVKPLLGLFSDLSHV